MNRGFQLSLAMLLVIAVAHGVSAQDEDQKANVATATMKPITATIEVDGVFESTDSSEVIADTKAWTQLKVKKFVPAGAHVKAGDPVVWFETDEYEKKVRESRQATELARIALQEAEFDLKQFKQLQEIDRLLNERSLTRAKEDMKYFLEVDRERKIKSAKFSLKMSEGSLENAKEEFEQLQKMYKADELTEESEEIVLKRARRAVESSQFSLESAQLRAQQTIEVNVPREQEQMEDSLARLELTSRKKSILEPLESRKKLIEFEKAKVSYEKQQEADSELNSDGEKLILRAPSDGVVYYGLYEGGKWAGGATGATRTLKVGQTIAQNGVVMTIVNPAKQRIRLAVDEKSIGKVQVAQKCVVSPTAFSDTSLAGTVKSTSLIPVAASKFVVYCSVETENSRVMPGMTGKANITIYDNPQTLVIPAAAVLQEDGKDVVEVVTSDGRTAKRTVKVGVKSGDEVEILDGVLDGEVVRLPSKKSE